MSDQVTRLSIAEFKIEQHERLHQETQASIKVLTDGINQLIQAEVRREQDSDTFKRIFQDMEKIRDDFSSYKQAQSEKELNAYRNIVLKAIALIALAGVSIAVGHFGTHLIG